MIKLPEGVEEGEAPNGNLEEPRCVFFFQEKIPSYQTLLLAKTNDYIPPYQLLPSLQFVSSFLPTLGLSHQKGPAYTH
jgi:hypothetical protein